MAFARRSLALLTLLCVGTLAQDGAAPEAAGEDAHAAADAAAAEAAAQAAAQTAAAEAAAKAQAEAAAAAAAPKAPPAAQPRPPPASPAPPPPPPTFDSDHAAQEAKNKAISRVSEHIMYAKDRNQVDGNTLRSIINEAVSLGVNHPDLFEAKKILEENTKSLLDIAVGHQGDIMGHMHMLTDAVRQATLDGHTSPQVATARKLRNEKITAMIDAAGKAEDLREWIKYLDHARGHAGDDLSTVIAAHQKNLHDKAIAAITQHKLVGEKDRNKLRDAILICRSEGIDHDNLGEAEQTLRYQDKRHHLKDHLPSYIQENNVEMLHALLGQADEHNISDPEVLKAKQHFGQIVKNMVAEAAKGGSGGGTVRRLKTLDNGTTVEVEEPAPENIGIGDMVRAMFWAKTHGMSDMETSGLTAALNARSKARLTAALSKQAQVSLASPDRLEALREMEGAVDQGYLAEADRKSGHQALQTKVKSLITDATGMGWTTKPNGLNHYAELINFAVRPSCKFDLVYIEEHMHAYQAVAIKEYDAAIASNTFEKLHALESARYNFQGTLTFYPNLHEAAYHTVEHSYRQALERATRKHSFIDAMETMPRQVADKNDAARRIRNTLDECEKEGFCDAADHSTWEARALALEKGTPPPPPPPRVSTASAGAASAAATAAL